MFHFKHVFNVIQKITYIFSIYRQYLTIKTVDFHNTVVISTHFRYTFVGIKTIFKHNFYFLAQCFGDFYSSIPTFTSE